MLDIHVEPTQAQTGRFYPSAIFTLCASPTSFADVGGRHVGHLSIKIFDLLENPAPAGAAMLKKTAGDDLRVDFGEFRLVYRVIAEILEVPLGRMAQG